MAKNLTTLEPQMFGRVISGLYKGKKLILPNNSSIVRPTTDRVKELLFNVLQHNFSSYFNKNSIILDAFCGSGALAIEALSRGFGYAILVDENKEVLDIAVKNVKSLNNYNEIANNIVFFNRNIFNLDLNNLLKNKINVVLLDPPYKNTDLITNFYNYFSKANVFDNNTLFITLSDNKDITINNLKCVIEKSTTKTIIKFYKLI